MNLTNEVTRLGGLAATHELYAAGATRSMLRHAVSRGRLLRVRQGWYCLPGIDESQVRAARVGGVLACVSAAAELGLWVRGAPRLHVAVPHHSARLRTETSSTERLSASRNASTVIHWTPVHSDADRLTRSPIACLMDMALCMSPERTVAAADSAIRKGLVTIRSWNLSIATLPTRLMLLLSEATGQVESISESVFRFRLRRIGLNPRCQVMIVGVGRVDFMFGTRLIVEVDGWAYHSDPEQFEKDRRRDARLSIRGYRVLRFSYKQIFEHWPEVRSSVLAALSRGDHH